MNNIKNIAMKLLVIALFLVVSIFLFSVAPNFIPKERFDKHAMRVVIDDKDITNSLNDKVFIEGDQIMMSQNMINKFFDIYVYYDAKYDTAIVTSKTMIGKIKLNDNKININGEEKDFAGTAKFVGEGEDKKLYIPMNLIKEVTDIDVYYDKKVVATTPKGLNRAKIVKLAKGVPLKIYKENISGITGKAYKNEILYVFDTEGKELEDYVVVRNIRGDIGYVKYSDIKIKEIVSMEVNIIQKAQETFEAPKFTLAWEYAEYYSPDRSGQSKIKDLNVISPTWLYLKDDEGNLRTTIDKNYIAWAKSRGYKLWPALKNDHVSLAQTSTVITDMKLREKFISQIVKVIIDNDLDGINIDFENMKRADKNEFSEFARELSASLRNSASKIKKDVTISVDVTIPGGSDTYSFCYDRKALSNATDYIMLMAYDQSGSWSTKPGPTASISWVESNIQTMLGYEGVSKDKLVLCVPFYSPYWKADATTGNKKSYSTLDMKVAKNLLDTYKNAASWSENSGQYYVEYIQGNTTTHLWVEDESALAEKVKLVNKYDLAGVAAWRLGFESSDAVWKTIGEVLEK